VILANPRYTGRQVWNRQGIDHNESIPGDKRTSRGPIHRWNPTDEWAISTHRAHPPLDSEADFIAAQNIDATPRPEDGSTRRYHLTGLVLCRTCGRRAEAHWIHDRPGYRCRHGRTSASPAMPDRPKPWYQREDVLLTHAWCHLAESDLLAAPGPEDLHAVAGHLRATGITITCDTGAVTLDHAHVKIAQQRSRERRQPADVNVNGFGGG
jgi:site-specific DNA recombinase